MAFIHNGVEYLYILNNKTKMLSLLTGENIIEEYMSLYKSGYNGCIECQISSTIKSGISKVLNEIVEVDLKITKANELIHKINQQLNKNLPIF
ncbi:MAG: hypothetical protein ACTSRG_01885 [Candidatus Helarchaeota archaeon]